MFGILAKTQVVIRIISSHLQTRDHYSSTHAQGKLFVQNVAKLVCTYAHRLHVPSLPFLPSFPSLLPLQWAVHIDRLLCYRTHRTLPGHTDGGH